MPTTVQKTTIATGDDGVVATLRVMADLIDRASDDPVVVSFARSLVVTFGSGGNPFLTARVLAGWMARVWRYVDDPTSRELLRDANAMIREYAARGYVSGDCDEAAVFGASLGTVVGISAELTVLAFVDGMPGVPPYSHVFATLLPENGPAVNLDVTRPGSGTPIPAIARALTVGV